MRRDLIIGIICLAVGIILISLINVVGKWVIYVSGFLIIVGGVVLIEVLLKLTAGKNLSGTEIYKTIAEMLKSASKSIVITSGALNSKAYVDNKNIKNAMEAKIKEGVDFSIVCGRQIDKATLKAFYNLGLFKYSNFKVYCGSEDPRPHGILIDGKQLKVEAPHLPGEEVRTNFLLGTSVLPGIAFGKNVEYYRENADMMTEEDVSKILGIKE